MSDVSKEVIANPDTNRAQKPFWKKTSDFFIELIGTIFWLYAIIKLFIFDIDVWLLNFIDPRLVWILNYKLPILLSIVVVAMLVTRSARLALIVLYIAFYPFVVLFWKIPQFVWKQRSWLLAFAIINTGISFFQSFRRDFIIATIFLICAVLITGFEGEYALFGAAICVLAIVGIAYVCAFSMAFKPSAVFQVYTKIFPAIRTSDFLKIDSSLRGLPTKQLTTEQVTAWTDALQRAVLYNRVCLFIAKKLRDFQNSRMNTIASILNLICLLIFTVFSFTLINFALYKIDPSLFQFSYSNTSFFSFLYYSAGSMFYATNGLMPDMPLSQMVQLIQFLFAVFLLVIFITLIVTMRNEKYTAELGTIVQSMEREGRTMESVIKTEFNLNSVANAIEALQTAKAGLVGLIILMTKSLDE